MTNNPRTTVAIHRDVVDELRRRFPHIVLSSLMRTLLDDFLREHSGENAPHPPKQKRTHAPSRDGADACA